MAGTQSEADASSPPPPPAAERAEDRSWFARYVSYSFVAPLLARANADENITLDDVFAVPDEHASEGLLRRYDESKRSGATTYRALFGVVQREVITAGLLQLVNVTAQASLPVLVRGVLVSIEEDRFDGLYYILGIFFGLLIGNWCNQTHLHKMDVATIRLRAVAVRVMYRRMLTMRSHEHSRTAADLVSVIASDTERFKDVAPLFHLVWAGPLLIAAATYIVWRFLNWPALVGVAVMSLLLPLTISLAGAMGKVRRDGAPATTARVRLVAEMLQGIRVVKMYRWEAPLMAIIGRHRAVELVQMAKELACASGNNVMAAVAPHVAAFVVFALYIHFVGPLRASDTFATMSMLTVLKHPMVYFGTALLMLAQAIVAAARVRAVIELGDDGDDSLLDSQGVVRTEKALGQDSDISVEAAPMLLQDAVLRWSSAGKEVTEVAATDPSETTTPAPSTEPIEQDSTTAVTADPEYLPFSVGPVTIPAKRGSPVCVLGPVGSGKSMLLRGILGEVACAEGAVASPRSWSSIGYASQEPHLFSGTVRENIILGLPYDAKRFVDACTACQLWEDLDSFPSGIRTIVGERGVTLSGGQKARVALARVAYARSPVAILDDPFSALDARTGRLVLEGLLDPANGLLRESVVIYSTHAPQHQWCAATVVALAIDGSATVHAMTPTEAAEVMTAAAEEEDDAPDEIVDAPRVDASSDPQPEPPSKADDGDAESGEDEEVSAEEVQTGTVSPSTYGKYLNIAGRGWFPVSTALMLIIERLSYVGTDVFLSVWTSAADGEPTHGLAEGRGWPAADDEEGGRFYLTVFGTLVAITLVLSILRMVCIFTGCRQAARRLFEQAFAAVTKCPAEFFDTTPTGRILNRLSHDVDRVGFPLSAQFSSSVAVAGWMLTAFVVSGVITPQAFGFLVPAVLIAFFIFFRFRALNVHLQRLDVVSRSIVQSFVFESLVGADSIRAFSRQGHFFDSVRGAVDGNTKAMYALSMTQRWVGVRVDTLGATTLALVALTCWLLRDDVGPGLAGVSIMWGTSIGRSFVFLVNDVVQGEAKFVSVERLFEYIEELPSENKPVDDDPESKEVAVVAATTPVAIETPKSEASHGVVAQWPPRGEICFEDVCMRYRESTPLVLDRCSFVVPPHTRVGVVGRTGSGKSSTVVALFRLRELVSGRITIDGTDTATLPLDVLRGGKMCVIPQDPVLFSGTARQNIDPFDAFDDGEVWSAFDAVRLGDHLRGLEGGLNAVVEDRGANFSVGQRQLFCIARALLRQPTVLIMDEATANVDVETDAMIQAAIRRLFAGRATIFEIAHRLHSVMGADRILVLGAGHILEYDTPTALLDKADSSLNGMLSAMPEAVQEELRNIAQGTARA